MTVTAEQAAADFETLLGRAELGETILIERGGKPIVQLRPATTETAPNKMRVFGRLAGQGIVPDDVKTPFEKEIEEMFFGE